MIIAKKKQSESFSIRIKEKPVSVKVGRDRDDGVVTVSVDKGKQGKEVRFIPVNRRTAYFNVKPSRKEAVDDKFVVD